MVVWFRRLAALSCAAALMLSGGALPSFSAVAEEENGFAREKGILSCDGRMRKRSGEE